VEDAVYDLPGIRLGLRNFLEMAEPFSPEEIRSAVLAAVSRSIPPDRLVGYAQTVLESARQEARDRERLNRSLATVRPIGVHEASSVPDERSRSSQEAEPPFKHAGPGKEARALWHAARSELELQMTKATFATWVRPAELLAWESQDDDSGATGTRVVLGTPNEYVRDWLENRLYTPIQRTLSGIAGHPVAVKFEVRDHLSGQDLPLSNS
jgi:hypothetical protein